MQLYSLLTGPDDETFCQRVSAKLHDGWTLYGSPSLTFDGKKIIAGQAVIKEVAGEFNAEINRQEI
jgi:hypothetical protein